LKEAADGDTSNLFTECQLSVFEHIEVTYDSWLSGGVVWFSGRHLWSSQLCLQTSRR